MTSIEETYFDDSKQSGDFYVETETYKLRQLSILNPDSIINLL
jgi:hypothetical protein